jgi:hypothetical protein
MAWMMMGSGWLMWLSCGLVLIVLVLAIAALIKYLFTDHRQK